MSGTIKREHLGESKVMNCGLIATIIAYRKFNDIDIQFEDGTIIRNRAYNNFKEGQILHPGELPIT